MATLQDLMRKYADKDYVELLFIGKQAFADAQPALEEFAQRIGDVTAQQVGLLIAGTCLAVDGQLSPLEYRFVSDLFGGVDRDCLLSIARNCNDARSGSIVYTLCSTCAEPYRTALLTFCLVLLSVDERATREENGFLQKLLEKN